MSRRWSSLVHGAPSDEEDESPIARHLPTAQVPPGHVFVSRDRVRVTTILGSCVAVCLFDPIRKMGGVNHFMLPHGGRSTSARFGNAACAELLQKLEALGARTVDLVAKTFGGACVLDAFRMKRESLGTNNVEAAHAFLRDARIPLVASDVGGSFGRKLVFDTGVGTAWVKEIQGGKDGL